MNKLTFVTAALGLALLSACKPMSNPDQARTATAPGSTPAPAASTPAKPKPVRITPERIAEIVASGRKGFWASVTEVCPKDRPVPTTILTWNVTDTGAKSVKLHVIDPTKNTERPFGGNKHGPVGERETGHWLRPGMIFKLRSSDDNRELGSVTITEKGC